MSQKPLCDLGRQLRIEAEVEEGSGSGAHFLRLLPQEKVAEVGAEVEMPLEIRHAILGHALGKGQNFSYGRSS